ncbi:MULTISPECIES: YlbF family regulator [Lactobacillus]|uniref:UPF0342 protein EJK17_06755 n=1 Tax=Lactobacillus xujianguonis TaxID=2495899 RepID=A0A437SUI0_9LACO|nr:MULTISPECIES: YlbF family regulator [Lactobacillus]RVU70586.1 YlbF family regulator [Lactobacillus xujianguonis]RVU73789.1 YlbF family regulator [Lactobacillus xujianguonis]
MVNVYDSANQLAEDLKKTPEYAALEEAVKSVEGDATSRDLFAQMDDIQNRIINAQQTGAPITDELENDYTSLNAKVQKDTNIVKLLTAEQGVYKLIDDLQKTFTAPINDVYKNLRK